MAERGDRYYWRLLGTGISFSLFGIGGLLLRLAVFPLLQLWPGNARQRALRARLAVHHCFRFFVGFMRALGLIDYEIIGLERLNKPGQLVIATHPSLIDVVFLISLIRDANCIVKSSLFDNIFMRGPLQHAGYIPNSRSESMLNDCVAALEGGESLIIFPEGTRSLPGQPLHFQRGAAYVALAARLNVTPVTITCEPSMLTKQEKWYQIPPRRGHFKIHIGQDLDAKTIYASDMLPSQASRQLARLWLNYFTAQTAQQLADRQTLMLGEAAT